MAIQNEPPVLHPTPECCEGHNSTGSPQAMPFSYTDPLQPDKHWQTIEEFHATKSACAGVFYCDCTNDVLYVGTKDGCLNDLSGNPPAGDGSGNGPGAGTGPASVDGENCTYIYITDENALDEPTPTTEQCDAWLAAFDPTQYSGYDPAANNKFTVEFNDGGQIVFLVNEDGSIKLDKDAPLGPLGPLASMTEEELKAYIQDCIGDPPTPTTAEDDSYTGTEGEAFSEDITTNDVPSDELASITKDSGSLPAGLTLDTATGAITGTPTESGTFTCDYTLVSTSGSTDTATITIVVEPAAAGCVKREVCGVMKSAVFSQATAVLQGGTSVGATQGVWDLTWPSGMEGRVTIDFIAGSNNLVELDDTGGLVLVKMEDPTASSVQTSYSYKNEIRKAAPELDGCLGRMRLYQRLLDGDNRTCFKAATVTDSSGVDNQPDSETYCASVDVDNADLYIDNNLLSGLVTVGTIWEGEIIFAGANTIQSGSDWVNFSFNEGWQAPVKVTVEDCPGKEPAFVSAVDVDGNSVAEGEVNFTP